MWEIAAGVIIGGTALGMIALGLMLGAQMAADQNDSQWFGWWMAIAGVALSIWVVFFKA